MIKPNIQIFQNPGIAYSGVQQFLIDSKDLVLQPDSVLEEGIDAELIDKIRNQPLPNDIAVLTDSVLKDEIADLVKLLGQFVKEDSVNQALEVVKTIHEKLNDKEPQIIKNWIRLIEGLHPELDSKITDINDGLPYFKNRYSEVMGTNTISYYADESGIDLWFWSCDPLFKDNIVTFPLEAWEAPSYIRESTRQKLSSDLVEYIQESNTTVQKQFRRSVIYDSLITTSGNGAETVQARPIPYNVAHGSALNSDWYHQTFRILGGEKNKFWGKHDVIFKLYEPHPNGYFVHLLFNYITSLQPKVFAEQQLYKMKAPLGIEETFPRTKLKLETAVSHTGQKVLLRDKKISDDSLVPKESFRVST